MVDGGAQILAESDDIDLGGAHVVQCLFDFGFGFAQAQHQAGLGQDLRSMRFGMSQDIQGLLIAGSGVAYRMGQAAYGFEILGEDLQPGVDNHLDAACAPLEIRRQGFDCGVGIFRADCTHAVGIVLRAAIGQIVAIHRGEHDVTQVHQTYGTRRIGGFLRIQPAARIAGIHRAETASAGADRAHQHQGCGAMGPAFADVRALGFLANRGELVVANILQGFEVARVGRQLGAQPSGFLAAHQRRRCGMGLDAVLDRGKALRRSIFGPAGHHRDAFELAHAAIIRPCMLGWRGLLQTQGLRMTRQGYNQAIIQDEEDMVRMLGMGLGLLLCGSVWAKVSVEEAARLGAELTPTGAEKAGLSGLPHGLSIPKWDGGWVEPAGEKRVHAPENPFKDEAPLFVITAKNYAGYQDILTQGQIELLKLYPNSFKMRVYPSHRTSAVPEHVNKATIANATRVELNEIGSGFSGTAHGYPFPIPKTGQELIWNHMARFRTNGFRGFTNSAVTMESGDYVIERAYIEAVIEYGNPDIRLEDWDNVFIRLLRKIVAPANKAGDTVLVHAPLDRIKNEILIWSYNPGTRKVRRIAEVGYDNPANDGLMTHDQIDMFNGPLDRYNFKLVGKKPVLVPYNSYDLHSKNLKYEDIVHKGHINPELVRYELHRCWVLEATVKPSAAHIYKRRTLYLDEDSWLILLQDIYDERDQFWRTGMSFALQYPNIPLQMNAMQAHYDLQSRRYVVINMQNEEANPVEYDFDAPAKNFTTSALKRFGDRTHR